MKQIWRLTAMGVALAGLLAVVPGTTEASLSDSMTYLTFSGPIALPGVTLAAGTYIFELPVFETPSLVRVWSRDRSQVFLTAFTTVVERPRGAMSNEHVTLGEARRGEAKPIRVWYPIGKTTGRAFIY
jgi:hypothetical protein